MCLSFKVPSIGRKRVSLDVKHLSIAYGVLVVVVRLSA